MSTSSTPSPISDGSSSEGSALRAFVDEAIAKDRQALAAMSPRSALFSHTSLHGPPLVEQSSVSTRPANGVVDKRRHVRKRSTGERRKRAAAAPELAITALSPLELERLRKNPKAEALRLREMLQTVVRQAHRESTRAAELERANLDTVQRFRVLNENRVAAQQEAANAARELRLYQLQLDNAQKEIDKAQEALKLTEKQRDEAEAAAARARAKARKLQQQKLVASAREEGRRLGFEAGFDHAQKEREIIAARRPTNAVGPVLVQARTSGGGGKGKGKERAYPPGDPDLPVQGASLSPVQRATMDDIASSPEMSPSQLPIRNLPDMSVPIQPRPSARRDPSQYTPLRPFQPPPETYSQSDQRTPTPQRPPTLPPSEPYSRSKTPSIQIWPIDIPPAEQVAREYNTNENPNDIIVQRPREEWVTASKYREIRGSVPQPPTYPGQVPPQLRPARRPQPFVRPNIPPPSKAVKFPILSRPSLAKTKQQATSWYRSLSFRKKNKPVIDPIAEEPATTPQTASARDQPTTTSTGAPPDTANQKEMYGVPAQPPSSWYQSKHINASVPPSVRSQDYAYPNSRRRPTSDASTRVSQFDLLATPDPNAPQSVKSGKEKDSKKVKERDSLLSVIKEDPSSRGNTPSTDRYFGARAAGGSANGSGSGMPRSAASSSVPQPNFGQRGLQQQSSYGTFDSSVQNRRRSRRPPSITVPDPDAPLEPAGVAYSRVSLGVNGKPAYPAPDLTRRPSRISEKTTPDTSRSIAIEVVPPSGFAPDVTQSPPHTGRNHLSPYHVFHPPTLTSPRIPPAPSMASLRNQIQGNTHLEAPRRPSHQTLHNAYASSTPKMNQKASTTFSGYGNALSPSVNDILRLRGQSRTPLAPESVRSGRSKRPPRSHNTSQSSLVVVNPDPPEPGPGSGGDYFAGAGPSSTGAGAGAGSRSRSASASGAGARVASVAGGELMMAPPVRRVSSNASMRSTGSYSKYNPDEYVDPAYWGVDGPGGVPVAHSPVPRIAGLASSISRPASVNSGLSYV